MTRRPVGQPTAAPQLCVSHRQRRCWLTPRKGLGVWARPPCVIAQPLCLEVAVLGSRRQEFLVLLHHECPVGLNNLNLVQDLLGLKASKIDNFFCSTMNENTAMKVAMVTSGDPRFPPENILDGSVKTFWASTGLFPQELILTFASPTMVKKVTVWSTKVASWTLGRSLSDRPSEFEDVAYQETDDTDPALQVTTFHVPAVAPSSSLSSASPSSSSEPTLASAPPSRHIRLTIRRGHADFCSIHRVAVQGETSGAPFTAATLSGGTSSSYAGRMSTQQAGGAVVVGTGAGGERSSLVMVGGGSH